MRIYSTFLLSCLFLFTACGDSAEAPTVDADPDVVVATPITEPVKNTAAETGAFPAAIRESISCGYVPLSAARAIIPCLTDEPVVSVQNVESRMDHFRQTLCTFKCGAGKFSTVQVRMSYDTRGQKAIEDYAKDYFEAIDAGGADDMYVHKQTGHVVASKNKYRVSIDMAIDADKQIGSLTEFDRAALRNLLVKTLDALPTK